MWCFLSHLHDTHIHLYLGHLTWLPFGKPGRGTPDGGVSHLGNLLDTRERSPQLIRTDLITAGFFFKIMM